MSIVRDGFRRAVGEKTLGLGRQSGLALFLMTLWFGLLAGWLELGLILAQGAIHPSFSPEMVRVNRHFTWMVPVSDAMIFGIAGLGVAGLASLRWRLARWIAIRIPLGMAVLAPLLNIESLNVIADIILACGFASAIGHLLERRAEGFGRLRRLSFPVMALGMLVIAAFTYVRIASAEQRASSRSPAAKPGAPNVLLIVLDTVRASCLSLHGHYRPTTPNLERLASRGVVFTEAATAPWTAPTHASIMTGRWPHELSIGPYVPLDGTFPTLAETLGREGYATAGFVGNIYYCNALLGLGRGFARYEDAYENQTVSAFETLWSSSLGKSAIRVLAHAMKFDDGATLSRKSAAMVNRDFLGWLSTCPADRPFFAFLNYYDAHRPYILDDDPKLRFGMATLPMTEQKEIDGRFQNMVTGKPIPEGLSTERINAEGVALCHDSYDSCIASLDHQVGLLVDEIERRGLLENTLVIVTSDHGEQIGEHGLLTHGASVYREEVHVPLLVIPPSRLSNGVVVNEPVSLREIPATVAEWVKLGTQSPFPGNSLTRFLDKSPGQSKGEFPVLCELQHNVVFPPPMTIPFPFGPARSLVSRDRVYIRRGDGGEELYDLLADRLDLVNLVSDPRSQLELDQFRNELSRLYRDETITTR